MRYARSLDQWCMAHFGKGKPLQFLLDDHNNLVGNDPYAIDTHLREKNKIMYYHGTTCVLVAQLKKGNTGAAVHFGAHKRYKTRSILFSKPWSIPQVRAARPHFENHLRTVIRLVTDSHYRSKKEGYWQNRISLEWGRRWQNSSDWIVIDREAVIGHKSTQDKRAFYAGIRQPLVKKAKALCGPTNSPFGKAPKTAFGDELDLLALGPDGELVCIELKHGSSGSGIYWGPLQTALYQNAFQKALKKPSSTISREITQLINQKIQLGLLPKSIGARIKDRFNGVKGYLMVAEPVMNSYCWHNLAKVMRKYRKLSIPVILAGRDCHHFQ